MPIYDFKCNKCGKIEEGRMSFKASEEGFTCETCGGKMERQFTPTTHIHNFERPYKPGINAKEDHRRALNSQVEKGKLPDNFADLK